MLHPIKMQECISITNITNVNNATKIKIKNTHQILKIVGNITSNKIQDIFC